MGIFFVYQNARSVQVLIVSPTLPYFSISLSLNVLLTLMIIIRLVLHARDTRAVLGRTGIGGLYKTVITMLAESCGIYALNSLLYIGLLGAGRFIANSFPPILGQTQVRIFQNPDPSHVFLMWQRIEQVIAPFLIILRAANKSALTSDTFSSMNISEFKAMTQDEFSGGVSPVRAREFGGSARV